MSRFSRNERNMRDTPVVKIGGKRIDIYTARIVYKCAECFGDLERHNFGLRCKDSHEHRRFLHRDEVAEIQQQQREQMAEVQLAYKIVNGEIVYKEKS